MAKKDKVIWLVVLAGGGGLLWYLLSKHSTVAPAVVTTTPAPAPALPQMAIPVTATPSISVMPPVTLTTTVTPPSPVSSTQNAYPNITSWVGNLSDKTRQSYWMNTILPNINASDLPTLDSVFYKFNTNQSLSTAENNLWTMIYTRWPGA